MKEFFNFLTSGRVILQEYSFVKNIGNVILGYFIFLSIYILSLAIFAYFSEIDTTKTPSAAVGRLNHINIHVRILIVCLIYPILEEIAFRLPLNNNPINIIIGLSFFSLFTSTIIRDLINWNNYKYITHIIIIIISCFFLCLKQKSIIRIVENNYLLFFHLLSLCFCLFHYDSYKVKESPVTSFIPLVSALFFAYYLSFVRMKFGFGYSIIIHCFHNTLFSLPYIIKNFIR
ncbi:Uncharacterised protein [Candidatus Ornithobacterium hominis]|uniref:CAAX prenyl protease 2/Lysostaphin resistance protein A-like domain-containing protein n=1 Tax=Candidatus Ornithobacterium hominis TaxID=2497989 RepID=A0A383U4M2_9FLAO|nr:CPBP family glutamic-type intramembrane protease [Candidatus Ornithobacterium hominis]MCT7904746.1 CPBP family glutamic-type intramembrane protease [Candidatus Ornithobacterium hominis]SZD73903.1 Uncharacterised protein [Candidatus Ornithobacterium hominis]